MATETKRFALKKGLDLPIVGEPKQEIGAEVAVRTIGVLGTDYVGMRPTMEVRVGDHVRRGDLLFTDKKNAGVRYTAPGGGTVKGIHRGEKRALLSVEIEIDDNEEDVSFSEHTSKPVEEQTREQIRAGLVASGLWVSLRTRPYSKVPEVDAVPHSIFVTAIDSNPLAARPDVVINQFADDFGRGLTAISQLTDGPVYVCKPAGTPLPQTNNASRVTAAEFDGPHPSGLVGTHIHLLDPVSQHKTVWHLNYQDVIAIGRFFRTGVLAVERVVSIAGPAVKTPCLVRTRLGANTTQLIKGQVEEADCRVISGSVLSGRTASAPVDFLGRYHLQVSALAEGREREFLGWQRPGLDKFSIKGVFLSKLFPSKRFSFTTSTEGSKRAMVPIGMYEKVMPLDILPTFLLRALIVDDADQAQALGCLELDEEDLALCTFVCPGKYEYGPILRRNLTTIEREG